MHSATIKEFKVTVYQYPEWKDFYGKGQATYNIVCTCGFSSYVEHDYNEKKTISQAQAHIKHHNDRPDYKQPRIAIAKFSTNDTE